MTTAQQNPKDLMQLCSLWSTLLTAGLPLWESLQVVHRSLKDTQYEKPFAEIIEDANSGDFMTDRMRRYPDLFPGEAVDILAEGEHNGYLDRALNTVAEMYEQRMVPDPNRIIDGEQQIIIGNQIIFLRNLGERLNAGDSIVTSLDQMAMESAIIPPDELRGMAGDIRDKGMKLSAAMQARLQYFKPIVIDYVNAGERGGVLEATLEAAHKYLLRDCM